jgi:hypothetical protein
LLDLGKIEAGGRKFRDLVSAAAGNLHVKNLGAEQFARGSFVHGKEAGADPVPAVIVVRVIHAHHDFQLGLSPESRTVGAGQTNARIEFRGLVLAIAAGNLDSRLVVGIFAQKIVGQQFQADVLRAGHFVFGVEDGPIASGADPVAFALVRTQDPALSARELHHREDKHQAAKS